MTHFERRNKFYKDNDIQLPLKCKNIKQLYDKVFFMYAPVLFSYHDMNYHKNVKIMGMRYNEHLKIVRFVAKKLKIY